MRTRRRLITTVTMLIVLAAIMTGCDDSRAARAAFVKRAAHVAREWDASAAAAAARQGLTLFSNRTWQMYVDRGDIDNYVLEAMTSGRYAFGIPNPPQPPPATLTFADGATLTVPLETAYQAYQQMSVPDPPCRADPGPCTTIIITGARLAIRHLMSGRGQVDVPVWRFSINGVRDAIDQVAVVGSAMTPIPDRTSNMWGFAGMTRDDSIFDFGGATSLKRAGGKILTFRSVAPGPCDAVTGPLVYEDTTTVVLGTIVRKAGHDTHCSFNLAGEFTVRLAAPIGNRVVLDALTGYPIMYTDDLLQPVYP